MFIPEIRKMMETPESHDRTPAKVIATRLEGGIGDHLLGMRPFHLLRARYPDHAIHVYCDCAGQSEQLEVVRLSPCVSRVIAARQIDNPVDYESWGQLERLQPEQLAEMRSADIFFDGWGTHMCLPAARVLNLPIFEVLSERPVLAIPAQSTAEAARLLAPHEGLLFVGLNLTNYGADVLRPHLPGVWQMLASILEDPRVRILNIFRSAFDWAHWPGTDRDARRRHAIEDAAIARELSARHPHILSCVDLPIATVGALLARCRYFIGTDNGVKHLAWALGVPLTHFIKNDRGRDWTLRWAPDSHTVVPLPRLPEMLVTHVERCRAALAGTPGNTASG